VRYRDAVRHEARSRYLGRRADGADGRDLHAVAGRVLRRGSAYRTHARGEKRNGVRRSRRQVPGHPAARDPTRSEGVPAAAHTPCVPDPTPAGLTAADSALTPWRWGRGDVTAAS